MSIKWTEHLGNNLILEPFSQCEHTKVKETTLLCLCVFRVWVRILAILKQSLLLSIGIFSNNKMMPFPKVTYFPMKPPFPYFKDKLEIQGGGRLILDIGQPRMVLAQIKTNTPPSSFYCFKKQIVGGFSARQEFSVKAQIIFTKYFLRIVAQQ